MGWVECFCFEAEPWLEVLSRKEDQYSNLAGFWPALGGSLGGFGRFWEASQAAFLKAGRSRKISGRGSGRSLEGSCKALLPSSDGPNICQQKASGRPLGGESL